MYCIEKTMYGLRLTFSGTVEIPEMVSWVADSVRELKLLHAPFSVLVDMSRLDILNPEARAILIAGQRMYKTYGMSHSAVILNNRDLLLQIEQVAEESTIIKGEKYFSPECANHALDWVCAYVIEED